MKFNENSITLYPVVFNLTYRHDGSHERSAKLVLRGLVSTKRGRLRWSSEFSATCHNPSATTSGAEAILLQGNTRVRSKSQNQQLRNSYLSPNIIQVIISREIKWAGHATHKGEMRNTL
jgi:hypothetical protein